MVRWISVTPLIALVHPSVNCLLINSCKLQTAYIDKMWSIWQDKKHCDSAATILPICCCRWQTDFRLHHTTAQAEATIKIADPHTSCLVRCDWRKQEPAEIISVPASSLCPGPLTLGCRTLAAIILLRPRQRRASPSCLCRVR